jgi:hypothetical protein
MSFVWRETGPRIRRAAARAMFPLALLTACGPGQVSDAMGEPPQLASAQGASGSQPTAADVAADSSSADRADSHYEPSAGAPALTMEPMHEARPASSLAQRLFGVTIDDVAPLYDIAESLAGLSKRPTTRVIFDPLRAPTSYQTALRRLSGVSYVMGGLLDSVAMPDITPEAYEKRASDYVDQIGDLVDIWEIGIEANGEWLGRAEDVKEKVNRAYTQVAARDKLTALTLYYNEGCVQRPENEIFSWARANLSDSVRRDLDYVFITYYEDRCHRAEPDWKSVFTRLREIFPYAKLGFGGVGSMDETRKAEVVRHFYGLQVDVPGYVGGYFYWYFRQDMQPASKPLWGVLNQSLETVPL